MDSIKNILQVAEWWNVEDKDLKEQAENYKTLKITKSARGMSFLLILFSLLISLLPVAFGYLAPTSYTITAIVYLALAVLTYKGYRLAMLLMMVLYTVDKIAALVTFQTPGAIGIVVIIFWWGFGMRFFYTAFRVEQLRHRSIIRKTSLEEVSTATINKQDNKSGRNDVDKTNKLILPATILIASIILGGFYYASQASKQKSIEKQLEIKMADDRRVEEAKTEQTKIQQEKAQQDAIKQAELQRQIESQISEARMVAQYRQECIDVKNKNLESFTKAIESCTTTECVNNLSNNSDLTKDITSDFVGRCVERKIKTGW